MKSISTDLTRKVPLEIDRIIAQAIELAHLLPLQRRARVEFKEFISFLPELLDFVDFFFDFGCSLRGVPSGRCRPSGILNQEEANDRKGENKLCRRCYLQLQSLPREISSIIAPYPFVINPLGKETQEQQHGG